MTSVKQAISI